MLPAITPSEITMPLPVIFIDYRTTMSPMHSPGFTRSTAASKGERHPVLTAMADQGHGGITIYPDNGTLLY